MRLQKGGGLFGDVIYRVSAQTPAGRVYYCAIEDRADRPDRKGVADGLWQARRVLRAAILNDGFWQPGDEGALTHG